MLQTLSGKPVCWGTSLETCIQLKDFSFAGSQGHKEPLQCEGDRVLAKFAQRGCGVSILGHVQKPSGHGT